jgi:hypothetical protein
MLFRPNREYPQLGQLLVGIVESSAGAPEDMALQYSKSNWIP